MNCTHEDPSGRRAGRLPVCRRFVGLAATLMLIACEATATVRCVPLASGVPALPGAPNFLDSSVGEPNYWTRADDPRWRGALSRSWGNGASPHVTFQALRVVAPQPYLYLSWVVKVAPAPQPLVDKLRLAFRTSGGTTWALEVIPFNNVSSAIQIQAPVQTAAWRLNGGTWTLNGVVTPPAWVHDDTRVWLETTAPRMWAVSMRVPMTNPFGDGGNLSDQFPVAFHLHVNHSDTTLADYRLDDSVTLIPSPNTGPPVSNTPDNWTQLNVALPTTDPACENQIRISASDIGTTNSVPHEINLNAANTFFVRPENVMPAGTNVGAQKIAATIRIANWGTQPNWNDVVDPMTSLWRDITNPASEPMNATSFMSGTKGLIEHQWTPACGDFVGTSCPGPHDRRLHQCMLVELHGGGYVYNPTSVYRNMDFVTASTFERRADVSVAGLKALNPGSPRRDVYLHLQTFQMPSDVKAPPRRSTMFDLAKVEEILQRHGNDARRVTKQAVEKPPKGPSAGVDFETLDQVYPTYLVHAFHDTGETVVVDGGPRRVLRPQTSFGYYVNHDGPLAGWEAYLEGAERIAADYYRIAVPEGGTETITTRIVARDRDRARFAVWLALGQAIPHGSFSGSYKRDLASTLGLEYIFGPTLSIEGTLGVHRFKSRSGAPDIDVTQIGIDGKWSLTTTRWVPFVQIGAGAYAFDPGSTRFGVNVGVGIQTMIAPAWSLEGRYVRHRVASNSPNTDYSTLQIGLRREF